MFTKNSFTRRRFFGAAVMAVGAAEKAFGFAGTSFNKKNIMDMLPLELDSLSSADAWINSPSLTSANLKGKLVLIDFCTYTCINWIRTLPYIRAWVAKYKAHGLVVIGVHTPEFVFEKNINNVRMALKSMMIDYPIAIDNDYTIWDGFNNRYWPALYLVDAEGRVRHQQFGEGEYGKAELMIRQLLSSAHRNDLPNEDFEVEANGVEAPADWNSLASGENYLGYDRTENFASPGGALLNKRHVYSTPAKLSLNHWALSGDWTVQKQAVLLHSANGLITCCFHARDLHLVMGPVKLGTSSKFRVRLDEGPPGSAHGLDVDEQGYGILKEQRLYQLIRQQNQIVHRQFEIEFYEEAEVFAFTFG